MKHEIRAGIGVVAMAVAVLFLGAGPGNAQQVPFFVIVHPDNPVDMLSREIISDIFLKKSTEWSDGLAAEPVDLSPDSRIREAFSREVHNRSADEVQRYWQAKVFSGAVTPPSEVGDDAAAVDFVRQHRGGIAYVSTSAPLDGVRLIAIVHPPVPIKKVPPSYTDRALRMRIQGEVILRVQVSEEGEAEDISVIQGLQYGLTEAAIRAVKRWRFEPATSGGLPVSAEIDVTVTFKL